MAAMHTRLLNAFELVVVVRCRKVGRATSNDNDEISSGHMGQGRAGTKARCVAWPSVWAKQSLPRLGGLQPR